MALIPTTVHGVLDYAGGLGSLAAPKLIRDRRAAALLALSGAGTLVTSAFTDYELGIRRRLPMPAHLLLDAGTGGLLLGAAQLLRRRGAGLGGWAPLALVGLAQVGGALATERTPGDRTGSGGGAGSDGWAGAGAAEPMPRAVSGVSSGPAATRTPGGGGPGLAVAPVDAPGPSVSPLGAEASDVERTERADELAGVDGVDGEVPDDDVLVAREESAAAAEARRIGGRPGSETGDPAMDPVYQAGGGDQEGWEQTENELIENATHGGGRARPEQDAFTPELEADRAGAVYGEADRIPSTEVVEDPGTGEDDPGSGAGLAAERGPGVQPDQEP